MVYKIINDQIEQMILQLCAEAWEEGYNSYPENVSNPYQ